MSAPDGGSLIRPPEPSGMPARPPHQDRRDALRTEAWSQTAGSHDGPDTAQASVSGQAPSSLNRPGALRADAWSQVAGNHDESDAVQANPSGHERPDAAPTGDRGGRHDAPDLARRVRAYSMASAELFQHEQALITTGASLPDLGRQLSGRAVVVLTEVPERQAARAIRRLLGTNESALVAVGESGVAAATALRLRPAVVVGHPGEAGLRVVQRAKATVLPQRPNGQIAGAELLRANSLGYQAVTTSLSEADLALLLAAHSGAQLVVHQAPPSDLHTLVAEGSNTFNAHLLVLAQLQDVLIGSHSLAVMEKPVLASWLLVLLVLVALLVLAAAVWLTPWGQSLLPWTEIALTDPAGWAAGWT